MSKIMFQGPYSAQGDLNIFECDKIPENLVATESAEEGKHILAHSETGHNHVIASNSVDYYRENDFVSYIDVKKESNVVHLRSFDTHKTIVLPPGKYRLTQQREYIAEGFRRAAD